MKISVDSREFADCMRKIQPAVFVSKDKKDTTEGSIQLMITKEKKMDAGYVGLAVAYDGKKQLFSAFLASEIEMEEVKKDIYISGKRLCDTSMALDNGKELPMVLKVGKDCLMKKGGSEVHLPLGEQPVIIYPSNDWYIRASVDTKEFIDLFTKGARFYRPGDEGSSGDVCICFDIKENRLLISSTDVYKLAFYGMDIKMEKSPNLKKLEEEGSTTLIKKDHFVKMEIDGEQIKILSRFLSGKNTEIFAFEKYLYFKSDSDIALFMAKDVGEKPYALEAVMNLAQAHSRKCTLHTVPRDILDALTVFDVANQDEAPYVYITKDKSGALCLSTKGKLSKTLVGCEIKGEFMDIVLNSKVLRQVITNYEKDDAVTIFTGTEEEPVLITDKDDSKDFNIITRVSVEE